MYAIVELGGKQHRVSVGEKLRIDLKKDCKKGDPFLVDKILMIGGDTYSIGKPFLTKGRVMAKVVDMGADGEGVKGSKIRVFKKKRRKGFHKTIGHRARFTEIVIEDIQG